ncbi:MAG: hypothetical protein JWM36_2687 [Hyphomicrobiales bacterium]|nr:hypothetical protein [Hyphomicrobiales bacterium]
MISAVATTPTPNAGASSAWLNAVQAQTNPSVATGTGASPRTINWRPWVIAESHFNAAYKAVAKYVADEKYDVIVAYFADHPWDIIHSYGTDFVVALASSVGLPSNYPSEEIVNNFNYKPYNTRYAVISAYLEPLYKDNYRRVEYFYTGSSTLSLDGVVQTKIQNKRTSTKVQTLLTNLQNAGAELANLNAIEAKAAARKISNLLPRWYQAVYFIGANDSTDWAYITKFRANAGV